MPQSDPNSLPLLNSRPRLPPGLRRGGGRGDARRRPGPRGLPGCCRAAADPSLARRRRASRFLLRRAQPGDQNRVPQGDGRLLEGAPGPEEAPSEGGPGRRPGAAEVQAPRRGAAQAPALRHHGQ